MNFRRYARFVYLKLLRAKGTPQSIACGAAIGVFVGLTPTIPFHTLIIFLLCLLFRASFLAGLISSLLVCNPFTSLPIYYFSYKIGNLVTPYQMDWQRVSSVLQILDADYSLAARMQAFTELGFEAFIVMIVGGGLLAVIPGLTSYYFFYYLIVQYRRKRSRKHVLH